MFKYVKFTKVETEFTVLEFRGQGEDVKVHYFDVDVVSIEAKKATEINELVESQDALILCTFISKEEFREFVSDSMQIERIRDIVKEKIATKYDIADEMAMIKKDADDAKRIAYQMHVDECLAYGYGLKAEMGY